MEALIGEEYEALRESVRALATKKIAPFAKAVDEESRFPQEAFEALQSADLAAAHVDSKYGVPESERQMGGTPPEGGAMSSDMGGAPLPPPSGGEAPLSENETKKDNILSLLGDNNKLNDLFDYDKAQQNIYEIENKLKDILNQ